MALNAHRCSWWLLVIKGVNRETRGAVIVKPFGGLAAYARRYKLTGGAGQCDAEVLVPEGVNNPRIVAAGPNHRHAVV